MARLVGPNRARVLRLLEQPRSTTRREHLLIWTERDRVDLPGTRTERGTERHGVTRVGQFPPCRYEGEAFRFALASREGFRELINHQDGTALALAAGAPGRIQEEALTGTGGGMLLRDYIRLRPTQA